MIRELWTLIQGALKFDTATYAAHLESKDALRRGVALIAVAALLAGLFPFISSLVASFQSPNFADIEARMRQQIEAQSQFNPSLRNPAFRKVFEDNFQAALEMVKDIAALKPNLSFLPGWLNRLLLALSAWASRPVAALAGWMGYALWVMLVSKLLGGRATLTRLLGAATLSAAPHTLDLFTGLLRALGQIPVAGPCLSGLGSLISLGFWAWGLAIYVKATAQANEFGLGKATVAVLLPGLLALMLALLGFVLMIMLIALGAGRG